MNVELLLLLLGLAAVTYVPLAWWSRRQRTRLGLDRGTIVSADDSVIRAPTLRSERLGLVGRCDHSINVDGA